MPNIITTNNLRKTNVAIIASKVRYLCEVIIKSFIARQRDRACPFCNSSEKSELMNKVFFIKLFRCNNCGLMFRYPKDSVTSRNYRDSCYYWEPKISILPNSAGLTGLKINDFKGGIYDISDKITLIKKYIKEGNMLDYGASWGYHLWQFIHEGFSGTGYEIDIKRARFGGRNLGLKIISDPKGLEQLGSSFGIVFANHVLEHITDIRNEFGRIYRLLKDAGYLFVFVPDCGAIVNEPWRKTYVFGQRHSLAFDEGFFTKNLYSLGFKIIEIARRPDECELIVVARKMNKL